MTNGHERAPLWGTSFFKEAMFELKSFTLSYATKYINEISDTMLREEEQIR